MSHILTKNTRVSLVPGSPSRPAVQASPGYAAYTSNDPVTICGFNYPSGGYFWSYPPPGVAGSPQLVQIPGGAPIYSCRTVTVPTYHPAVAPTVADPGSAGSPTQVLSDYNLGWNAGARSMASFDGDGFVQFTPLDAVGIVAGFNNNDLSGGYTEILFGLYFAGGIVRVYESGINVFSGGAYTRGDVFRITRVSGVVSYYRNGTLLYTSAATSAGPLFLDTSFYSGGDTLDAPSIGNLTTSAANLPTLAAYGSQGNVASGVTSLPRLAAASSWLQGGAMVLPMLLSVAADRPYAFALAGLPALTGYGDAGMAAPGFALSSGVLPALMATGLCLTGQIGGGATVLPSLWALGADRPYATSTVTLPALGLFSYSYEGNLNASMGEGVGGHDALLPISEMAVIMNSGAGLLAVVSYSAVLSANLLSGMSAGVTLTPHALLNAIMRSAILAASDTPLVLAPGVINDDTQVWVLDWDSNTNTSYESYDFNSFGQLDGRYYGAKADGIYALDGDTDAGAPIRASINMGRQSFGDTPLKHVPHAYAGVSATGTLYLRVTVDGATYTYAARNADTMQRTQRFDLGKGMRGSYYTFELYNVDGDDFDLDTVEFEVVSTSRRI